MKKLIGCIVYRKKFVIDFSGNFKAVKFRLGTHMYYGLMYVVYQNPLNYIP